MRQKNIFLFILFYFCLKLSAQQSNTLIRFTENKHQWQDFILYRAQLDGGALYAEKNKLTYGFYDKETYRKQHENPNPKVLGQIKQTGFNVVFVNANSTSDVRSENPSKDYNNYFIGNDKSKWASGARNFQKLWYKNVWQGVDLEILGQENSIKYNFYVKPNTDAAAIQLQYNKTEKIYLKKNELYIKTILNELVEHEPYAYQVIEGKKVEVPCKFHLKKNTVSFSFPKGYDKKYELIIDPVLVFSCQSGSLADNFGMTATYDNQGNLYSGGTVFGNGYPVVNAYDSTFNGTVAYGMTDVVITKYDSSGMFLHYSTYIGGPSSSEIVTSLIVDAQNNLYLYGATGSHDFPITAGAYDNTFHGGDTITFMFNGTYFYHGTDIYVAKLSSGGNQLLASTYMGGSGNDGVNTNVISTYTLNYLGSGSIYTLTESKADSLQYNYGDQYRGEIQLDNVGNPVVCSSSRSTNFPTKNAFDNTLGGMQDAVVFKLNPNLSQLLYSTYLGGSNNDAGYALFLTPNNEVYATGGTRSSDFPATAGAYNTSYNGGKADGYIAKISANGSTLMAATYYGTNNYDQSYFVQLDDSQHVYIYGQSLGNMPVLNVGYSNVNGKQFVSKFDSSLSTLKYSTVFGNGQALINISPAAFLIDCSENIYLSGWGGNIIYGPALFNMPLTSNAYQSSDPDGFNFYLMVLSKNAQQLLYGTYFGGAQSHEHVDGGTSRFNRKGIIYQSVCAGCGGYSSTTIHQDFPIHPPNAWPGTPGTPNHNNQNYNCNNGVFKFDFEYNAPKAIITDNYSSGCAPLTVQFNNNSVSYGSYQWNFGGSDTNSTVLNPVKTYTAAGTYTVTLLVKGACVVGFDTTRTVITVLPKPHAAYTAVYDSCKNSITILNASSVSSGTMSYNWNFGNGQTSTLANPPNVLYNAGSYTTSLVVSNGACSDTAKQVVAFTINPMQTKPDTAFCAGGSVPLSASGSSTSYTWQPSAGLSSSSISNPVATPSTTTVYTVTMQQTDALGHLCNFNLTDTIKVFPRVVANFSDSVNVCGNTVMFTDLSYANITKWHWNFGDTIVDSIKNPSHSYTQAGTYTISLWATNQYGCPDSTHKVITLSGFNPISISRNTTVCSGKQVQLNASGGISYTWTPPYNLNNANIANPIATPTANTNYTLYLAQTNSAGNTCISTLHTNIIVPAYSNSVLTTYAHPDTITEGASSQLGAYAPNGYIVWYPDYNLSSDSSLNPTAAPHHTTTYSATYIDANGCPFVMSKVTIYVIAAACNESTVFVPNTFTPNGDGRNDVLYARSPLVTNVHFVIADRWGQIVFETNDINKGWDGIFNGKPCNPDVFGYFITYTCNNGQESFKKGNVTLIR
ncbi:MAG: PKD domain-containing protein [Bacteroidetes bacterium]|nr:PKD domain-containing protein [Bacteroidota bacterium]